jgi:8-oxo-dGTP diphosphatase
MPSAIVTMPFQMFCTIVAAVVGEVTMEKIMNRTMASVVSFLTSTTSLASVCQRRNPKIFLPHSYPVWPSARRRLSQTIPVDRTAGSAERRPRVPCAGGIVFDPAGRLLLIRRGRAPSRGTWSVPGGRCLPGESSEEACVREVVEETGIRVQVVRFAGRVERNGPDNVIYDIEDFVCRADADLPRAGDDARDARWVTLTDLDELELAPQLRQTLSAWHCLPS